MCEVEFCQEVSVVTGKINGSLFFIWTASNLATAETMNSNHGERFASLAAGSAFSWGARGTFSCGFVHPRSLPAQRGQCRCNVPRMKGTKKQG